MDNTYSNTVCPYCYAEISASDLLELDVVELSQPTNCGSCHYVVYFMDINAVGDLIFKTTEDYLLCTSNIDYVISNANVQEALEEIESIRAMEEDEIEWRRLSVY